LTTAVLKIGKTTSLTILKTHKFLKEFFKNLAKPEWLRKLGFLTLFCLKWLILPALGLFSRLRIAKLDVIFLVFQGSKTDLDGYCPRKIAESWFFKGKPSIAGIITLGFLRYGLTLVVPETAQDFRREPEAVRKIQKRLKVLRFILGAKAVAIASVGPKYFKKHCVSYEKPFVYGLKGRVFSAEETIDRSLKMQNTTTVPQINPNIAIVGVGEIGRAIIKRLKGLSYNAHGINFLRDKRGKVFFNEKGLSQLAKADIAFVQTPKGADFVPYYSVLKTGAIVIDDTHPKIRDLPPQKKQSFFKVAIGKEGIRFFPRLPGYVNSWIPGCVLEAIVEIATGKPDMTQAEFSRAAKKLNFFAHLASQTPPQKTKRDYVS
jgi:hypothetical protein